ncbi:Rieske (2Fe-2S) protein [Gallaecimonas sp. GXIMD1310]|uniref:Rieske (2Fe-2S) protein n=1 Tax=Gallaecimonas sp. GXIMD1310 TaxID=3131926 RepID=UPI00324C7FB1
MNKPTPFTRLKAGYPLCALDDIANPGARGFYFESPGGEVLSIFVTRRDQQVSAFVNRCPHMQVPLNAAPNDFLTKAGDQIICAKHGALFSMDSGLCSAGPCRGHYLQAVPVKLADGQVLTA